MMLILMVCLALLIEVASVVIGIATFQLIKENVS